MKKLFVPIAGIALLVVLSGCGVTAPEAPTTDGDKPTITIGVFTPTQGGFAEIGKNITNGFQVAIDQVNAKGGVAGGSMLAMEIKDQGTSPQTASQAARDLISGGVNLLGGLFSSADCGAMAPIVEESPAVLITGGCASDSLTGGVTGTSPFERTFGVAIRDQTQANALVEVIAEEFPNVTNYDAFGFDYNWGHETWETFRDGLKADGVNVEVNSEQFVPLGTTDFRTQVAAISSGLKGTAESRGILLATYGGGTAAFLKQAAAYEIPNEVAVIANSGEYYNVARSLEGAAPEVWNAYDYVWTAFDNEMNETFVTEFEKIADGDKPVGWSYHGYLIGLAYAAAIDKAGSGDPDMVRDALEGLTFDSPSGSLTMGAQSHQLAVPSVISHTVGDASSSDGVRVIKTVVIPYKGK